MDEPILIKAKAIEQRASDGCVTVEVDTVTGKLQMFVYPEQIVEERKTGRWERYYSRLNVYADLWWHCSVCGYKNENQYAYRYHHFCPNCGCKIEADNEQTD